MDPLIAAWKVWDLHPGAEATAKRMEDECQVEAGRLGVDATELRIVLSGMVQRGLRREEALEQARHLFSDD
jgi:hypothetical protein